LAAETIVAGIEIDGETVTATVTVTTYEPDQDEEIVIMPEEEDDTMTEEDSTTMMTEEDSTMTEDDDMTTDQEEDDEPLSGNNMKFSTIVISLLCLAIGLFGQWWQNVFHIINIYIFLYAKLEFFSLILSF